MRPNQRRFMRRQPRQWLFQTHVAGVPRDDARIAQQPRELHPLDRRFPENLRESRRRQRQNLPHRQSREFLPCHQQYLPPRRREPVPRTHLQAHIAPVNPVPDPRPQLPRNDPLVFDRLVGNTPPRIDHARRRKRLRRARLETPHALSAEQPHIREITRLLPHRRIGKKFLPRQNCRQKQPVPMTPRDQHRVLADEPEPRLRRPAALEHRTGVDIGPVIFPRRAIHFPEHLPRRDQTHLHRVVIILVQRIPRPRRPARSLRLILVLRLSLPIRVADAQHNHRPRLRQNQLRSQPLFRCPLHPLHIGVLPRRQPRLKFFPAQFRQRRETHFIKTDRDQTSPQLLLPHPRLRFVAPAHARIAPPLSRRAKSAASRRQTRSTCSTISPSGRPSVKITVPEAR